MSEVFSEMWSSLVFCGIFWIVVMYEIIWNQVEEIIWSNMELKKSKKSIRMFKFFCG